MAIRIGKMNLSLTNKPATRSQLRSFGLIVGTAFGVIGLWPVVREGQDARWWSLAIAILFVGFATIMPLALSPIHRAWIFIGHVLGYINTKIILALGFYGIVMPIGLTMRLAGKDPMRRQYILESKTYRVARAPRTGQHMRQQF